MTKIKNLFKFLPLMLLGVTVSTSNLGEVTFSQT